MQTTKIKILLISPFIGKMANLLIQMKCLPTWHNGETPNGRGWAGPLLLLRIHFYDAVETPCMASLQHIRAVGKLAFKFDVAL